MNSRLLLISAVLRAAGFRRGNQTRRSSRSRRWSRSAQTLFASWAVLGQLGSMGVLVGEALMRAPDPRDMIASLRGADCDAEGDNGAASGGGGGTEVVEYTEPRSGPPR